jgi:proteasome assembly chaperone (PAC2) family protein
VKKVNAHIVITLAIDLLIAYYLLTFLNPHLKLQVKQYVKTVRYELYKWRMERWKHEARMVRGEIQ